MNLLDLQEIQLNHRKDLELRLKNAENNLKNLDRMAEEMFREIERRASEDKENFSRVFHTLTANEEITISAVREELGWDKPTLATDDVSLRFVEPSEHNHLTDEYSTQGQVHVKAKKNGGKKDAPL